MVKNRGMPAPRPPTVLSAASPLLTATGLALAFDGRTVFAGLDFTLQPGLTLVRGGDGRGKTSLLQMLAGERAPDGGRIERAQGPAFLAQPRATASDDSQTLRAWMLAQRGEHGGWDETMAQDLADAFGLGEHLDKSRFMLSTGTHRKGLLVAAFASGAPLTLLDTPWAALDARSRALVSQLLEEAARHTRRAFVVADHDLPGELQGVPLAGRIDLGD